MSQDEKPPAYWEGVFEAFRLIHMFIDWKEDNPESQRTIKQYIQQAQNRVRGKVKADLRGL
ncbi:MAG: hypothetical protein ACXACA_02190, partial [Candidatus Ranarchaeia archaeon]